MEKPTRIVIADDHPVVRSGLRLLLDAQEDFEVLAEASNVEEAERKAHAHRPDVLVLDLNMPGESTIEAIPRLRTALAGTRVVVLTMQSDPAFARLALQAGASGYVLKEAADDELVQAIRTAHAGGIYLNPQLGARLAAEPAVPAGPPDNLTPRELDILRLIALGHTNAEIGGQLFLSVRTVETHRAHILRKTGTSTRADLVRYALENGLVDGSTESDGA